MSDRHYPHEPTKEALELFKVDVFNAETKDMLIDLHEETETYYGWFRDLRFVSDPDTIWLEIRPDVWRTLSWKSDRASQFNGSVRSALVYLWGANPNREARPNE